MVISKEIPLTKGAVAIVDDSDYDFLVQRRWYLSRSGYAYCKMKVDGRWTNVPMHRLIMNPPDDMVVDHINGNKLDNRRENLRICKPVENSYNTGKAEYKHSIYKGVSWDEERGKWVAYICKGGKMRHLGRYSSEVDAALAYNEAAVVEFGEFARLNEVGMEIVTNRSLFLIGRAGVGKDEVGRYLCLKYGYVAYSLAWPIKDEFRRIVGVFPDKRYRAQLIDLGQSYRRIFGDDYWVKRLVKRAMADGKSATSEDRMVITDGRHQTEYDFFVVQRGFIPVRIVCDDDVRFDRLLKRDGVDQRAVLAGQETELDDVEVAFVIDNNGTKDELYRQIDEMMRKIRGEG